MKINKTYCKVCEREIKEPSLMLCCYCDSEAAEKSRRQVELLKEARGKENLVEKEAAYLYCLTIPMARQTVHRLLKWDQNKTIKQNSIMLGIQFSWTRRFAKRFNLSYERGH